MKTGLELLASFQMSGLFLQGLTPQQEINIDTIQKQWLEHGDGDIRKLAYIYATAYHEGANLVKTEKGKYYQRILSIKEIGFEKRPYAKIDPLTGQAYYGRGFVQLTWKDNYTRMSKVTGLDLVHNPDLILTNVEASAKILVVGMMKGMFTGKELGDFIHDSVCDFTNARGIINGRDKAVLITGYALEFLKVLS